MYYYGFFSLGFNCDFINTRLAGYSGSNMTYLVSSGTLNLNSIEFVCENSEKLLISVQEFAHVLYATKFRTITRSANFVPPQKVFFRRLSISQQTPK